MSAAIRNDFDNDGYNDHTGMPAIDHRNALEKRSEQGLPTPPVHIHEHTHVSDYRDMAIAAAHTAIQMPEHAGVFGTDSAPLKREKQGFVQPKRAKQTIRIKKPYGCKEEPHNNDPIKRHESLEPSECWKTEVMRGFSPCSAVHFARTHNDAWRNDFAKYAEDVEAYMLNYTMRNSLYEVTEAVYDHLYNDGGHTAAYGVNHLHEIYQKLPTTSVSEQSALQHGFGADPEQYAQLIDDHSVPFPTQLHAGFKAFRNMSHGGEWYSTHQFTDILSEPLEAGAALLRNITHFHDDLKGADWREVLLRNNRWDDAEQAYRDEIQATLNDMTNDCYYDLGNSVVFDVNSHFSKEKVKETP